MVCGGAGYIGSHLVRELNKNSAYSIVVYDNLSTGHICTIPKGVDFVKGDIRDRAALDALFLKFKPDAVLLSLLLF